VLLPTSFYFLSLYYFLSTFGERGIVKGERDRAKEKGERN